MAIYSFDTLNSTNLHLKQNFNIYENFDIILADKQTDGYGRFKRNWIDLGSDNLFMSICLKSNGLNQNLISIAQFSALILAKTLEQYGLNPVIKWPNDILVNSSKIAGILAESVFEKNIFKGIVLGLGINLFADKTSLSTINRPVTALNLELNKKISKIDFIDLFMKNFKIFYSDFYDFGFSKFKDDYVSYMDCFGQILTVKNYSSVTIGVMSGITDKGLLILNVNGKLQEISAGDISF